jgi:hypothetical protein
METVSPSRVFAAAIRRLLEREALTSPISPELSASRLDVLPQTGLNGRHGSESRVAHQMHRVSDAVQPRRRTPPRRAAARQEGTPVRNAICTRKSSKNCVDYVSPEANSSGNNGGCPGPRIRSICTS